MPPPDKPARINAELAGKFVDDLTKITGSLASQIATKTSELNDIERKIKANKKGEDAKNEKEKQTTLVGDLKTLRGDEKDYVAEVLNDAKSLRGLLVAIEQERCGYRIYFLVACGEEKHEVNLVSAAGDAGKTADARAG